jgi:hypothetical protein
MKFPTKNVRTAAPVNAAPHNVAMKEFLADLPAKTRNTIRGVDLTLINEAIAVITSGNAKINGKAPKTREENYIVIASYFKAAKTPIHMFFDGAVEVKEDYTVNFKFKDQPYTVKLPEVV